MKYTLADCQKIYAFFNKDFFGDELGVDLGKCLITTNKKEAEEIFGSYNWDELSGLSWYKNRKNYIYINRMQLDSKKIMSNTILHEMIHLYDQAFFPDKRQYRKGHGAIWKKTAKLATEIYGKKMGPIEQNADPKEVEKTDHYKLMHSTKTLANAYIVVLRTRELVPVKSLSPEEIEVLKGTNIRGIFKVKPNLEQSAANRVKCYASFGELMDDITLGVTQEEEERYSQLQLKLGTDSERIWINSNNS